MARKASERRRNNIVFWSKVLLTTLLIAFFVRTFFIESYTISSRQMESSLLAGDHVFVDKTAYGIRLPMTPLSIPFTFDNIWGIKSYVSLGQLPYKRIMAKGAKQNDIVLFNNPMETNKPLDKRSLLVSRCVGLPGDTIVRHDGQYRINGREYIPSPDLVSEYLFAPSSLQEVRNVARKHAIDFNNVSQEGAELTVHLNRYEAYLLNQELEEPHRLYLSQDDRIGYSLIVPHKGMTIALTEKNRLCYQTIILEELGEKGEFKDGSLHLDSVPQQSYTFDDDYYWMLSDNSENRADSNTFGFVPFRNIIGKLRFVWYNLEKEDRSFFKAK